MNQELDQELHLKITSLCETGNSYFDKEDYRNACINFKEAWDLIPEPKEKWNASTWVLTAIADTYFKNGDYDYALENLEYAMHCPNALGNPFIHLRLGQLYYENGNTQKAADELTRAYMAEGREIFNNEDSKYLDFLSKHIKI